jgi:hypothetical protein
MPEKQSQIKIEVPQAKLIPNGALRSSNRIGSLSALTVIRAEIGGEAMSALKSPAFKSPMINLYSRDLPRATMFYSELGFVETFRTPASGEPVHIELTPTFSKASCAPHGLPIPTATPSRSFSRRVGSLY